MYANILYHYYSPTPCRGPASDWYEAIQPYLMYSVTIRRWFVDTVFLQHKGRFCEYLLECPSVEVSLYSCSCLCVQLGQPLAISIHTV